MMEITSGEQNKPEFFTAANIRDDIKELGGVVKEAVKRELTGKFFSVTTDHWTSPNNETYSCLTAHWIQDGLMKQCVLAFEVFHGTTAGSELGKDFVTKFEEYGFELSFVIAVVTDTTGNMNTFGEYLRQKNVTHLYCVDHNLHLTAKLAFDDRNLPDSESAMKAARGIVEYFTKSTQATEKLLKMQPNVHLPLRQGSTQPVKLIQDVVTRWWSTYRMLRRLRELIPAIDALVIGDEKINITRLTDDQKKILEEVEKALQPMAEAQRILEGDTYPMISLVPFFLWKIRSTFQEYVDSPNTLTPVQHLARILLADFNDNCYGDGSQILYSDVQIGHRRRYVSLHLSVVIATALDPRMKHLTPFVQNEDERQCIWDLLSTKMEIYYQDLVTNQTKNDDSLASKNSSKAEMNKKARQNHDAVFVHHTDDVDIFAALHAAHDNHANQAQEHDYIAATCNAELARYRSAVGMRMELGNDPLQWWLLRKDQFPILFGMAEQYLAIPAMSAPSERLWSIASPIVTIRRAKLSSEIVANIMFLKENGWILEKHYSSITGKERILPTMYETRPEED